MSSNYHTPHATGAPLTAAEVNTPLGALDLSLTRTKAESFNVLDYGATRDGTTDDRAAIQAALNAANAVGGGVVVIPFGQYYVSSALMVYQGTHLRGAGSAGQQFVDDTKGTMLIGATGATGGAGGIITTDGSDVTGDGTELYPYVSDRRTQYSFRGINFKSGDSASTDGSRILVDLRYAYNIIVDDCIFDGTSHGGIQGLRLYNSGHVVVGNCQFQAFPNYSSTESLSRPALEVFPTPSLYPGGYPVQMFDFRNLVFAYCYQAIDIGNRVAPSNDGIHTVKFDGIFSKRYATSPWGAADFSTGITFNSGASAVTINSCKFEDVRYPIAITGSNNVRINNVFLNHATTGIEVSTSRDVVIDALDLQSDTGNSIDTGVHFASDNVGRCSLLGFYAHGATADAMLVIDNDAGQFGGPAGVIPQYGGAIVAVAASGAANRCTYVPVTITQAICLVGVRYVVGTSSGNLYVALYSATGSRLAVSVSTACPAAGSQRTDFTSPVYVPPGEYYLALSVDNTTATFGTSAGTASSIGLTRYEESVFPPPVGATFAGRTNACPVLVGIPTSSYLA